MSDNSKIEWTDATWNPTRGCTKLSPGCRNCYASNFAERWRGIRNHPFEYGFDLRLVPHKLIEPIKWMKPRHIFVDSMSDLFHEKIPDYYIEAVFNIIKLSNWHEFQICTKRSKRMHEFVLKRKNDLPFENLWLGVSVENREHGLPRKKDLQDLPSKIRFLSIEPLLENLGKFDLTNINWVITGGETGPGARFMKSKWVYSIIENCQNSKIPFFFQQWSSTNRSRKNYLIDNKVFRKKPKFKKKNILSYKERLLRIEEANKIIKGLKKYSNSKLFYIKQNH